jgi:predicted DsbA family dithiol-disulfide isomerase
MKVEIWSDIVCPFCYIGKRKFENAFQRFEHKDKVEVVWHSYQLDPTTHHVPDKSIHKYLAERKGWSIEYARQMNDHVTEMAAEAGLEYDFDKAIPANTLDAHRLTHLAAKHNLQDKAEETLFAAYFTHGKNIADHCTLLELGKDIGLDENEVQTMLAGETFTDEVKYDLHEARSLGISGVPFFLFNRKYAVSGAQPSDVFLQTFKKAWVEWKADNPGVGAGQYSVMSNK